MKYVVYPKALLALIIFVIFFGILAVAIITPSVILDFIDSITPSTEEELRMTYLVMTLVGAVILFILLRHKKPYKFKKKAEKNSR